MEPKVEVTNLTPTATTIEGTEAPTSLIMETYKVETDCRNCGIEARYELNKGTRLNEIACSNCGCTDLYLT